MQRMKFFGEVLTGEYYRDYWSDKFVENDLSLTVGVYTDYAYWGESGFAFEFEFSVSGGFSGGGGINANLGYGVSTGGYVGASIKSDTSLPLKGANVSGGIGIRGPVGGCISSGDGRNGVNISAGVGFGGYGTVSTPLF